MISLLLLCSLLLSLTAAPVQAAEPSTGETATETEAPWADDLAGYRENHLPGAEPYEAGCETALLLEMNSGIVVYAKNAETTVYPASLTKIMTCLVAIEYAAKDMDKIVTVSEEALVGIEEAGGEVKLKVGERMTLRDALYYLMVSSNNEAGNVIAEYVAADVPSFVKLMNKTAQELGCTGTHFANTHGLHESNHYSTARDLSIITRKALTYALFREICGTAEYVVPATNLSDARKLVTTNYLILNNGNRYLADNGNYYPYYRKDVTGIKTGYTSAAGRCVIARAGDGNLDLLCIVMGAKTRMMEDGSVRYDNFVEAKKLLNYGFDNYAFAKVAVAGIDPMIQVSVDYAQDKRGVVLIPAADVNCLLPKTFEKEKVSTDYRLKDGKGLVAPLEQGQHVGSLYVYYDGVEIGSADLETLTAVEEKSVDKAIADITGKDKTDEEKTTLQKLLGYWYVPLLVIILLFLILLTRNAVYRRRRRQAMERRRQRAILRDARDAKRQQAARGQQNAKERRVTTDQQKAQTRRIPNTGGNAGSGSNRGGRP